MAIGLDSCQKGEGWKTENISVLLEFSNKTKKMTLGEKKKMNLAWKRRKLPEKLCQSI